ncbi:hypothetical protein HRbin26_01731 [bacterium HR26]|nr:hypothetical protein HRbin26_01731 [bacterium HR26]
MGGHDSQPPEQTLVPGCRQTGGTESEQTDGQQRVRPARLAAWPRYGRPCPRGDQRRRIGDPGLGPEQRHGAGGQVDGGRGQAEAEELEDRVPVGHRLEQRLVPVGDIADAVAVGVVSRIVAPEVTAAIFCPLQIGRTTPAGDGYRFEVLQDRVPSDPVAACGRGQKQAGIVIADPVADDPVFDSGRERRVVDVDADTVVVDQVLFGDQAIGLLDCQAIA